MALNIKNFETKPEIHVKKLFNTYETFSILIFGSIALICFFFPQQVMNIIISQATPELSSLAAYHLRIMSPVIVIGAFLGLYYVIYNRGMTGKGVTPEMLPDTMTYAEKEAWIADRAERAKKSAWVLLLLIPIILTLAIDTVVIYLIPMLAL